MVEEYILGFSATPLILFMIGMVKPDWVIRWGEEENKTRKNVLKYYGLALVALFAITIGFSALSDLIGKNKLFTVLPILLVYVIYKLLDEKFDIKDKYLDIRSK